jgi:phospholipase/lecithinase/hemolysin
MLFHSHGTGVVFSLALSILIPTAWCTVVPRHGHPSQHSVWSISNFKSLITFGDSYTDESRLGSFITHNGTAPAAGTLLPEAFATAGGGRTWARYVVQYTGETSSSGEWDPALTLYNYAVSGAVCSNEITPR